MLPAETARVWAFLEKEPSLAGAILIGGTPLALRIGHRRSYDLDFCFPVPRLPVRQIEAVMEALAAGGISAQRCDDPAAYDEFLNAGMSLHDCQQDLLTDQGVKLTFLSEDADAAGILQPGLTGGPRLAGLAEIFQLKALPSAKRSTSRDAKPRVVVGRYFRTLATSFFLGLFVATSFAATWTDPVTTTPSFIQIGFGPYGTQLPGNGEQYCGPTAIAMDLYWLGANGFSQIAPSSYSSGNPTDVAAAANLMKVLGGLGNTSSTGGTDLDLLASAVHLYFSAKGIDQSQFAYTLQTTATASWFKAQLANNKIDSPSTITFTNLLVGWYSQIGTTNSYVRDGGHFVDVVDATTGDTNSLTTFNPLPSSFVSTVSNIPGSNPQTVSVTNLPSSWTVEFLPSPADQYQQIQTSSRGDASTNPKGILQYGQSWAVSKSALPTDAGYSIRDWQIDSSQAINTNGGNLSVIAALKGSGGLSKAGLGTLALTSSNILTGSNVLGGGTLQSTVTTGNPFGTGSMTCSGTSVLELKPADSTPADISLALASGSNSTLAVDNGGLVLRLTKGNNTALAVTLGGNTDGTAPNITRNNQGSLEITTDAGLALLGSSVKLKVAGSGGNLPGVNNGMVSPYTVGQDSDAGQSGAFLNYDSANGFQAASTTKSSEADINTLTPFTTNVVYEVNSNVTASNPLIAMYALQVGAFAVGGASTTLNIGSQATGDVAGLILNGGAISPQLQFGAAQADIYTSQSGGTISSTVSGTGGLVKFGPGGLTLSADNSASLSGAVYVNSGTLIVANTGGSSATGTGSVNVQSSAKLQINNGARVSGDITAVSSGTVSLAGGVAAGGLSMAAASGVQPGAILQGYGTIAGTATVGGDIKAGSTTGILNFTGAADLSSAKFYWQLNNLVDNSTSQAGTGWNALQFASSGSAILGAEAKPLTIYADFSLVSGPDGSNSFWNTNHKWTLFSMLGGWSGNFSPGNFQFTGGNFSFAWDTPANLGNLSYTAVPEPSTYALLAFGLVVLYLLRGRLAARA
jgi:hypothetical protein